MPIHSSAEDLLDDRPGEGKRAEFAVEQAQTENAPDVAEDIHSAFRTVSRIGAVISLASAGHGKKRLLVGIRFVFCLLLFHELAMLFEHFDRLLHPDLAKVFIVRHKQTIRS